MTWAYTNATYAANFRSWALSAETHTVYIGILEAGWVAVVVGYKWSNSDGCFMLVNGDGSNGLERLGYFVNNDFIVTITG